MYNPDEIIRSWNANAYEWIATIDNSEIESRILITNVAIVKTIIQYAPTKLLDVGCGEGWLTRELQANGLVAHGVDAIEALTKNAIEKGGEHYTTCTYADLLNSKKYLTNDVDAIVFNFSLLDKEYTESLLFHFASMLKKGSLVFIQTLHPHNIISNDHYISGWKEGSWTGMKRDFVQPYHWYFRTVEDWIKLFTAAGLVLKEIKEPIHPATKKPASIIFVVAV